MAARRCPSIRGLILGMIVLLGMPADGSAQNRTPPMFDRLLEEGDRVQITIPGTLIESAEVYRVTLDSLFVGEGGQEWILSNARIEALAVRERRTKKYVVGGVIGGALFGLASQVFLSPVLCKSGGCQEDFLKGAVVGGLVFGAGIGLIGYHEFRWKPLYP